MPRGQWAADMLTSIVWSGGATTLSHVFPVGLSEALLDARRDSSGSCINGRADALGAAIGGARNSGRTLFQLLWRLAHARHLTALQLDSRCIYGRGAR